MNEVRPAREDDLPRLTDIYNYYVEHTTVTFDTRPFRPAERQAWFDGFNAAGSHRLFVIGTDDAVFGYASSGPFRSKPAYAHSVETTIYLAPEATGQGLGPRLYDHLFRTLATTGVHRAYAVITLPNDASIALHERQGFTPVGTLTEVGYKFGAWRDTFWMERRMPGQAGPEAG